MRILKLVWLEASFIVRLCDSGPISAPIVGFDAGFLLKPINAQRLAAILWAVRLISFRISSLLSIVWAIVSKKPADPQTLLSPRGGIQGQSLRRAPSKRKFISANPAAGLMLMD